MRTGRWTEALELRDAVPEDQAIRDARMLNALVEIADRAAERLRRRAASCRCCPLRGLGRRPGPLALRDASAAVLRAEGRLEEALAAAEDVFAAARAACGSGPDMKLAFGEGARGGARARSARQGRRAARPDRRDPARASGRRSWGPGGRFHARLAALRGADDAVEQGFKSAEAALPGAQPRLPPRGRPARARRMARRAGTGRGGRAAARRGARDLRAARGDAVARARRRGQSGPR